MGVRGGLRTSGFGLRVGILLIAAQARADVKVDWAKGLVTADGVGVADRHAPNPAVARGTSQRVAEDAAKHAIAAEIAKLPLAAGGKLGDKLADKAIKARIDRAVDAATTIDAEPETDGSWRVVMAVPIEALRQAIAGTRALGAGDAGPQVVVIDGVTAKPAIGWKIGTLDPATLWVSELPAWAKDAPHVRAKSAARGAISVDGMQGSAATLFVILQTP